MSDIRWGDEENNDANNLLPDPDDLPDPEDHNNSNNVDNPIPDSDYHNNSDNNSTTEIPDEVIQQEEDMREEELAENIRINNKVGEGTQRGRGIINKQMEQAVSIFEVAGLCNNQWCEAPQFIKKTKLGCRDTSGLNQTIYCCFIMLKQTTRNDSY